MSQSRRFLARFEASLADEIARLPAVIAPYAEHALAGGKRVRPLVVEALARACGRDSGDVLRFALAVELIHKASLVQDDLPCMDFQLERSGRPALHVFCSPAEAVLTSDAMIAHAFALCGESSRPAVSVRVLSSAVLALAAGQAADLARGIDRSEAHWRAVSAAKTAALFVASAELGVIASGGDGDRLRAAASRFGRAVGLVYQWYDDTTDADAGELPRSFVASEIAAIPSIVNELPRPGPVFALMDGLRRSFPGQPEPERNIDLLPTATSIDA